MLEELEFISVPVCIDCGKPLIGSSKAIDRCWCDTVGRWIYQNIQKQPEGL